MLFYTRTDLFFFKCLKNKCFILFGLFLPLLLYDFFLNIFDFFSMFFE